MNGRRVDRKRIYAGWLCVALGFALIVLLGLGVVDPIGMSPQAGGAGRGAVSIGALLAGLLPSVGLAAGVFAIGLWLLKGPRR